MPQRTISATNVEELCFDIACHYYESGLYGFFEIDTCTWNHNPSDMTDMSLWCTSVIPFMTTRATYYMYSLLATGSIYDFQDGTICFDRCKARRLHLRYLSTTPHTDYVRRLGHYIRLIKQVSNKISHLSLLTGACVPDESDRRCIRGQSRL